MKTCSVPSVSRSTLNALRRVIIQDLPSPAITSVSVDVNTSDFNDEKIVFALSCVPIDREGLAEISCSGPCEVTPDDIHGDFSSPFKDMILATLYEGQTLQMRLVATTGTGKTHSMFQPVSACHLDPDKNLLNIEPYLRSADDLFVDGILNLTEQLETFKGVVQQYDDSGTLLVEGRTTIPDLVSNGKYNMPHPLIDKVELYESKDRLLQQIDEKLQELEDALDLYKIF